MGSLCPDIVGGLWSVAWDNCEIYPWVLVCVGSVFPVWYVNGKLVGRKLVAS